MKPADTTPNLIEGAKPATDEIVKCATEVVVRQEPSDVDQRPGGSNTRDAQPRGEICIEQLSRPAPNDAIEASLELHPLHHFDVVGPRDLSGPPEVGPRLMRCIRSRPTRKHCRKDHLLPRLRRPCDCVDARPDLEPHRPPEKARDLRFGETGGERLHARVMSARWRRVSWLTFWMSAVMTEHDAERV